MKNVIHFFIAFLLILSSCAESPPVDKNNDHEIHAATDKTVIAGASPLSRERLEEFQGCIADADCIYVDNGCCDCANGGEETAINATKLAAFKKALKCSNFSCTERGRQPPCGTGQIKCENKLCIFVPQKTEANTSSFPVGGGDAQPPSCDRNLNERECNLQPGGYCVYIKETKTCATMPL